MLQNKYRFLIGTKLLGISYEKKWLSQIETGIRLSYPIFGGNILGNLQAIFTVGVVAALPLISLTALFAGIHLIHWVSMVFTVVFAVLFGIFLARAWRSQWWVGVLLWPLIVIQELIVMVMSLVGYLRRTVTWKGRPIVAEVTS